MFIDKSRVHNNEEIFFNILQVLNQKLEATSANFKDRDRFYHEYANFISKLTGIFEGLQIYYQQNRLIYQSSKEYSKTKVTSDLEFIENADKSIKDKTEELISKQSHLEDLIRRMETPLEVIDYKKVAKLDVQENESLNNFFTVFFQMYYGDSRESFDWAKFKKEDVQKEKLTDFKSRLIQADYTNFTPEQLDTLVRLKDDPEIFKLSKDKKLGAPIVDLLAYLNYVGDIVKTQEEIRTLQYDICVIKHDKPEREGRAEIEAHAMEVKQENIEYLEKMNNDFLERAKVFGRLVRDTDEMIRTFKEERSEVAKIIAKEYWEIQHVPENVCLSELDKSGVKLFQGDYEINEKINFEA